VTVIMCVYNAGGYLRPAVESVLGQTYANMELLIVDDGSTDGCVEAVGKLLSDRRVRVIHQENRGKPAAMNAALNQMRGEFYALNDADDLSHPERIERQVKCMLENPDVAGVFCGHEIILDGRSMAPQHRARDRVDCARDIEAFRMPAHDPTAMYRASAVAGMRYEPDLLLGEGFDYILRVGEEHPLLVLGECLYSYRIHSQSITKRDPARRDRLVREVLKRACERRGIEFANQFPMEPGTDCPEAFLDNNLAAQFIESVLDQRRVGRRLRAIGTGVACSRLHPLTPHYHKALVYATAPMWVVKRLRRSGN
jgi:glycosyltransferase involved in cell wall biosynthesis